MKNETVEVVMEKDDTLKNIIDFAIKHKTEFACITIGYLVGQLRCHNKFVKTFKKMFNV